MERERKEKKRKRKRKERKVWSVVYFAYNLLGVFCFLARFSAILLMKSKVFR